MLNPSGETVETILREDENYTQDDVGVPSEKEDILEITMFLKNNKPPGIDEI